MPPLRCVLVAIRQRTLLTRTESTTRPSPHPTRDRRTNRPRGSGVCFEKCEGAVHGFVLARFPPLPPGFRFPPDAGNSAGAPRVSNRPQTVSKRARNLLQSSPKDAQRGAFIPPPRRPASSRAPMIAPHVAGGHPGNGAGGW